MATIKELQGAYPDVPPEVLRAPRRNKRAEMKQTIDALVAAHRYLDEDAPDGSQDTLAIVDAALALARGGK